MCLVGIVGCSNLDNAKPTMTSTNNVESIEQELAKVFKKMWRNVTLSNAKSYFETVVSDYFFTINADGIVQNKEQLLADTKRLELLEILDFQFFDQQIKAYNGVGIINGRIQAFADGVYAGEIFYTAIFVKENATWKYKSWQGTWTLDSPTPPAFISETE
jgi:hypothetical protein